MEKGRKALLTIIAKVDIQGHHISKFKVIGQ
jgi:hypothetical protein